MIEKTLAFGRGKDGVIAPQLLTVERAREILDVCLRFDAYVFIKLGEITIENHGFNCYTDFRGREDEIAVLSSGLTEKLPPQNAHSCWLDHLVSEQEAVTRLH